MTNDELLIRQAIAAEAEQAVDSGTILANLRQGAKPRRRRIWIVAVAGGAVAAGIVAVAVPLTASREAAPPATSETITPPPAAAEKTLLLLGTDVVGNPDSIVVAKFSPDGSIRAVSLPRDSGIGDGVRLNSVYPSAGGGERGANATAAEVEKLTGIRADHYATVDMAGFASVSAAVGGVQICLKTAVKDTYSQANFKAGKQTVSGDQALAFLRQRHGLANGELDRIARHQAFLRGLVTKLGHADAQQLAALSETLKQTVRTDPGLKLLDLARALTSTSSMSIATIPVLSFDGKNNTLVVDPGQVRRFTADFFASKPAAPPSDGSADDCVD
ncbi:transcriptional regulator [Kibdelosporangium aridum]|uniref:Transcriptional regulator n=1 Tax=Kibdelosporangium aridum TaxID=2030 RepID=A0A428YT70_KIBAR|nr:LCP family protein [Kibdelosporangium aridum]RSM72661.1 transcriptional regulator [Kibdelosporangium aridum]